MDTTFKLEIELSTEDMGHLLRTGLLMKDGGYLIGKQGKTRVLVYLDKQEIKDVVEFFVTAGGNGKAKE